MPRLNTSRFASAPRPRSAETTSAGTRLLVPNVLTNYKGKYIEGQRGWAGKVNRLPDRTGQETSCWVRKEDRIVREYTEVYIELFVS